MSGHSGVCGASTSSASSTAAGLVSSLSPRLRRRRQQQLQNHQDGQQQNGGDQNNTDFNTRRNFGVNATRINKIDYANILPEDKKLADISSNIWGTKFQITSSRLDREQELPETLGAISYKASLLHLQPRQMRLDLVDLLDNNPDPFAYNFEDDFDDDEEEEAEDNEEIGFEIAPPICMRENILRASLPSSECTDSNNKGCDEPNTETGEEDKRIASIAPLPTRLSFCLAPQTPINSQAHNDSFLESIINTVSKLEAETTLEDSSPCKTKMELSSPPKREIFSPQKKLIQQNHKKAVMRRSPVKTVVGQAIAKAELGIDLSPTKESNQTDKESFNHESFQESSILLRKLRMSVSCDNYLADAAVAAGKFAFGKGTPPDLLLFQTFNTGWWKLIFPWVMGITTC